MDTEPHGLDAKPAGGKCPADTRSFADIVTGFFRRTGEAFAPAGASASPAGESHEAPAGAKPDLPGVLLKHWGALKTDGISASQFIAFLQPLADLEGITVSYTYLDDDGLEHTYNRRREDVASENPLSKDIRAGRLSREKALSFALNAEGRVWIETNFQEIQ